jgi:hypothetical protein
VQIYTVMLDCSVPKVGERHSFGSSSATGR